MSNATFRTGLELEETRYLKICKCGIRHTVLRMATRGDTYTAVTCSCGKRVLMMKVYGAVSDKKCGALCLHAKGFTCDCSCGGKNHGGG